MENIYVCDLCGYSIKSKDNICPICKTKMRIKADAEQSKEIEKLISEDEDSDYTEADEIDEMKDDIKDLGNDHLWNCIEELKAPRIRAHERSIFLKAGGRVPESSFSI